jgi:hypothetical protein
VTFGRLLQQNAVYGQVGAKTPEEAADLSHGAVGYVFRAYSLNGNGAFATGVVDDLARKGRPGVGYVGGISAPANLDGGIKGAGRALMVEIANVMRERGFEKLEALAFDYGDRAVNPSAGTLWTRPNANPRFTAENLPDDRHLLDHVLDPYSNPAFYPGLPFREGEGPWRTQGRSTTTMQELSGGELELPYPALHFEKVLKPDPPANGSNQPSRPPEEPPKVPPEYRRENVRGNP